MKKSVALDGRIPHREQNEHAPNMQEPSVETKFAPPIPPTSEAARRFRQKLDNLKPSSR